MSISEGLLQEWDQEMANTRKTLERVPEDKLAWKPHEKSMPLGRLAGHITEMAGWASAVMDADSFDFRPPGAPPMQPFIPKTRQEVLDAFDKGVPAARAAIAKASDGDFGRPWTLMSAGQTIFSMPKIACLRTFVMNHVIHHRAQLGVYLRLNNVAVPSIYGPSADEGSM